MTDVCRERMEQRKKEEKKEMNTNRENGRKG
jgi:hypothetical protein